LRKFKNNTARKEERKETRKERPGAKVCGVGLTAGLMITGGCNGSKPPCNCVEENEPTQSLCPSGENIGVGQTQNRAFAEAGTILSAEHNFGMELMKIEDNEAVFRISTGEGYEIVGLREGRTYNITGEMSTETISVCEIVENVIISEEEKSFVVLASSVPLEDVTPQSMSCDDAQDRIDGKYNIGDKSNIDDECIWMEVTEINNRNEVSIRFTIDNQLVDNEPWTKELKLYEGVKEVVSLHGEYYVVTSVEVFSPGDESERWAQIRVEKVSEDQCDESERISRKFVFLREDQSTEIINDCVELEVGLIEADARYNSETGEIEFYNVKFEFGLVDEEGRGSSFVFPDIDERTLSISFGTGYYELLVRGPEIDAVYNEQTGEVEIRDKKIKFEFVQESGPGECNSDMIDGHGHVINVGESISLVEGIEIFLDDIEADPKAADISIGSNDITLDKRKILEGESVIFKVYNPEREMDVTYQIKVEEVATGMTFAAKWARISISECW